MSLSKELGQFYLGTAKDDVDSAKGRMITLTLDTDMGAVVMGYDWGDGTGAAPVYPNTKLTETTAGKDKVCFIIDENNPDRFVHMASALSPISSKVIDFYFDNVEKIMFVVPDMNVFEKEIKLEENTVTNVYGKIVLRTGNIGDNMVYSSGQPHTANEMLLTGPVDVDVHLIKLHDSPSMYPFSDSDMAIEDEFNVYGEFNKLSMYVSFGDSSAIFPDGIPVFRMGQAGWDKYGFFYAGVKSVDDLCIPISW